MDEYATGGTSLFDLGLEAAHRILREPEHWADATEWLLTKPLCVPTRDTFVKKDIPKGRAWIVRAGINGHPEYHYDNEAEHSRIWGPIARRLIQAYAILAEAESFRQAYARVNAMAAFGRDDALRITLLTALLWNRDFDGSCLPATRRLSGVPSFPWGWGEPKDCQPRFEGREAAESVVTPSAAMIRRALRYLDKIVLGKPSTPNVTWDDPMAGSPSLADGIKRFLQTISFATLPVQGGRVIPDDAGAILLSKASAPVHSAIASGLGRIASNAESAGEGSTPESEGSVTDDPTMPGSPLPVPPKDLGGDDVAALRALSRSMVALRPNSQDDRSWNRYCAGDFISQESLDMAESALVALPLVASADKIVDVSTEEAQPHDGKLVDASTEKAQPRHTAELKPPALACFDRPIKLVTVVDIIGQRSDVIGRTLITAGCPCKVINRAFHAEHDDLCKLFPRYRKHFKENAR